jgi:hypothetical protein
MAIRSNPRSLRKSIRNTSRASASSSSSEKVTALSIIYQAERQDKASNILASLALIAAALAYLGVAALLLGDSKIPGGSWTQAFLAFPLWIAASFQVLLAWNGSIISESIRDIEHRLFILLKDTAEVRPGSTASASGRTLNIYSQPTVLKIQSLISYGGIWAVVITFTIVCLAIAAKSAGWISGPVITVGIVYALILGGDVAAWLHVSKIASGGIAVE